MNPCVAATINITAFVIGQFLVTRKRWTGFLVWAGSNLLVAVCCLMRDNSATACMFLVYFAANVYSMFLWSRRPIPESSAGTAPTRSPGQRMPRHHADHVPNSARNTRGQIPEADMKPYQAFGTELKRRFGQNVAETSGAGQEILLDLSGPKRRIPTNS